MLATGGQRFYASSASTCRAAVPAAATVTAVPLRTAAALRFAVSHDGLRSDDKIHETALQRRWMLLGGALVAAGGLYSLSPAAAASSSTCELDSSPSGLKFCDEREGTGPEPVKGALIRCHYTGRLADSGRVFDSSYERGRPLTFRVGVHEVITGWDLGILGGDGVPPMKEGGKRTLLIPADLAYGERGAGGGVIPPNATLLFEVELLGKPGRR